MGDKNEIGGTDANNDSLEEFLAEYFNKSCMTTPTPSTSSNDHDHQRRPQNLNAGISNFSLGEEYLFPHQDIRGLEDSFINQSQLTSISSTDSHSLEEENAVVPSQRNENYYDDSAGRIVSIRSRRRSLSYDIIFNHGRSGKHNQQQQHRNANPNASMDQSGFDVEDENLPEISIRIHAGNSRRVKQIKTEHPKDSQIHASTNSSRANKGGSYYQELEKTVSLLKLRNAELEKEVKTLNDKLGEAQKTIGQLEIEVANYYCQ